MTFDEILTQVCDLLQRQGRVSYRAIKRRFNLDDDYLEDLKAELIKAQRLAVDEDGEVLVWQPTLPATSPQPTSPPETPARPPSQPVPPVTGRQGQDAERRQLTVLFCDLVDSTALSGQLDPEDLREVIRAYQATCAAVIERLEGHIAQYLGDGLLVYFGYPQAHEDDAHRAVRAGLGMVDTLAALNARLAHGVRLAVRIGIHTGVVVVGEVGGGSRQEQLALGDTPNVAARLQRLAAPDTVVLSAATLRLIQGYFTCEELGPHTLKGVATPMSVYRVVGESGGQSRLDVTTPGGLTPLVGREEEVALLRRRWEQATTGTGQVVLLSGEAGIGKSRLVQVLTDHVAHKPHARIEWHGSAYHQQSALYPVIDHLHRLLQWHQDDPPEEKLQTLEATLAPSGLALPDVMPLVAALLSLPVPVRYPPLTLTPQRQRQKTLDTLVAWLYAKAQRHPVLLIVEDLHWIDPSTLELLSLLIEQDASARLCLVLTARPEFHSPWASTAHLTQVPLRRFAPAQGERLAMHVAGNRVFPPAVLQEVVRKTDGVPLFVEELTKTVLESGLLQEREERYELTGPLPPLALPATLHDALMARLDRLSVAKLVAQLGATIGRQFAYKVLQAVAPMDEATLQGALAQLVQAELVAQRGLPPQATYTFKHALVQDAAYQSLLRCTRQQYHQRIAQVLVESFPDLYETQPEFLAYHYTEAGLAVLALPYWQQAGQRAMQRSAHLEAIGHLSRGLDLLKTLPDTPNRAQQELALQTTLGPALMTTKGYAAPDVEQAYARARELCQQVEESPQLFQVLRGLWTFYLIRLELRTAQELGEHLLTLAQHVGDPALLLEAHYALGNTLNYLGEFAAAQAHFAQSISLYDRQQHHPHAFRYGQDPGVVCRAYAGWSLWWLGYADQAIQRSHESLRLAQELAHPFSLAYALFFAAMLHQCRREWHLTQERAGATIPLGTEHGFAHFRAGGTIFRGWALAERSPEPGAGEGQEGRDQMQQGLTAWCATGAKVVRPYVLGLLAEAHAKVGQHEAGLTLLAEALTVVNDTGERRWESELYRLKGEVLLVRSVEHPAEAETCFQQALAIARRQQAKSWELRAAVSLARLWQHQSKRAEAYDLLAPIYGWFTEGFDTADLQEAKALLEEFA